MSGPCQTGAMQKQGVFLGAKPKICTQGVMPKLNNPVAENHDPLRLFRLGILKMRHGKAGRIPSGALAACLFP